MNILLSVTPFPSLSSLCPHSHQDLKGLNEPSLTCTWNSQKLDLYLVTWGKSLPSVYLASVSWPLCCRLVTSSCIFHSCQQSLWLPPPHSLGQEKDRELIREIFSSRRKGDHMTSGIYLFWLFIFIPSFTIVFVHPHPQLKEVLEYCPYLRIKSFSILLHFFSLSTFIHWLTGFLDLWGR